MFKLFLYIFLTFANNFIAFSYKFIDFIVSFIHSFLNEIIVQIVLNFLSKRIGSQNQININLIETPASLLRIFQCRFLWMMVIGQRNVKFARGHFEIKIVKFTIILKPFLNFLLLMFLREKLVLNILETFFEKHFLFFFHSFGFNFL